MTRTLIVCLLLLITSLCFAQQGGGSCHSEDHRAFDFWLGNWRVTNPDGSYAGSNQITKVENGCVLQENWTSATPGYTGTSMNYYDSVLGKWVQLWVDNQGQSLYMRGGWVDGSMVLISDLLPTSNGNKVYNKVSWTPLSPERVRQHWQTSPDMKEWTTVFDGLYIKKE